MAVYPDRVYQQVPSQHDTKTGWLLSDGMFFLVEHHILRHLNLFYGNYFRGHGALWKSRTRAAPGDPMGRCPTPIRKYSKMTVGIFQLLRENEELQILSLSLENESHSSSLIFYLLTHISSLKSRLSR